MWGIRRTLLEDEAGQEALNLKHTQLDVCGAGRGPFFAATAAPASPLRKAWAYSVSVMKRYEAA